MGDLRAFIRSSFLDRRRPVRTRYRRVLRVERLEDRRLLAITVNTLVDEEDGSIVDGDISLRDAIALAPADETINFTPALTSGGPATLNLTIPSPLTVAKSLTINGPGAGLLTIDASMIDPTPALNNLDGHCVMVVDDGTSTGRSVVIQGLTLTGGDYYGYGGGVSSVEHLTLRNMVIRDNAGYLAGGVYHYAGGLLIEHSEIYGNRAEVEGGGVYVVPGAFPPQIVKSTIRDNVAGSTGGGIYDVGSFNNPLRIADSLISNNQASFDGGGIASTENLVVSRSAISGNRSLAGNGGGIKASGALRIENSLVDGNSGVSGGGLYTGVGPQVVDSTFSNNAATGNGGGIYIQGTSPNNLILSQLTVSGNRANGSGGGIYATNAITLRHSTIVQNQADADGTGGHTGGGLFSNQPVQMPIVVDHLIVATNFRGAATRDDIVGAVALHHSLLGDNTGTTITSSENSKIGTPTMPIDPLLGVLAGNDAPVLRGGYSVLTHALLPGSPALDAGDPFARAGFVFVPIVDERSVGFGRVFNATGLPSPRIDIGALEQQPTPLFADYNDDGIVNAADYTVWRNTLGLTNDGRADGDRSFIVDWNDFLYWKARVGDTAPASGAVATASSAVIELVNDGPNLGPAPASVTDHRAAIVIGLGAKRFNRTTGDPNKVEPPKPAQFPAVAPLNEQLWVQLPSQVGVSPARKIETSGESRPRASDEAIAEDQLVAMDSYFAELELGGR